MDSLALGQRAALLRESVAFREAVERAEADIIREWKEADTTGVREEAHAEMRGLRRVIVKIDSIVSDGELEAARQE